MCSGSAFGKTLDAIMLFTDSGKQSGYNRMEDMVFVMKLAMSEIA